MGVTEKALDSSRHEMGRLVSDCAEGDLAKDQELAMRIHRMLASVLVLLCLVSLATVESAHADSKTITSEASYVMGDGESPSFAESMALQKAKQIALEEAGTYVESYTKIRNQDLTKDEIQTLAGGVLQVEIIEKTRTLVQDGLRVYLKIRATVTTDKMEELAQRIRGKNLAGEYRDLQTKYNSLTQEVTLLKETLAKSPSSLERETALNRIREQERSFSSLQRDETALFKKLISGEALVAEARKVLRLSDAILNSMLTSGVDLQLMDFNPTLRSSQSELLELQIDASYQVNDTLLKLIQQAATERKAVIDDVLLYRGDMFLGSDTVQESLLRAKLIKFPDTKENRDELHFLKEDLSHIELVVELFADKKLLGFCRFSQIRTPLVPGPKLEEKSFPVYTSTVSTGSELRTNLISSSKYFDSEAEYQEFRRLDDLVTTHQDSAMKKWQEKMDQLNEKRNQPGPRGVSPNDALKELERREALGELSPEGISALERARRKMAMEEPALDLLPKEIQKADKKATALLGKAQAHWLDDHPSFIRIESQRASNYEISSPALIIVNEKYVLAPMESGFGLVPKKLVMSEQSLKQLTHTTARLVRTSDVPAVYGDNFGVFRERNDCEGVVYRNGKRLHVTKPGENLGYISRRYGITVEQLQKWNNLKERFPFSLNELYPGEGQTLIVGDE